MRQLAPGLHVHERAQSFYGLEVGTRMTVVELPDGLLLYSPTNAPVDQVEALGTPRWLVAPNTFPRLYAGDWLDRGVEGWAPPALAEKRPDLDLLHLTAEGSPFGEDVLLVPLSCFELTQEVVLLHRSSRTLVVTDLVFNFDESAPAMTKAAMWAAGGYPGCRTTHLERLGMDRPAARRDLARLLELDFDRIVLCHGRVLETGGREALRAAFHWLDLEG